MSETVGQNNTTIGAVVPHWLEWAFAQLSGEPWEYIYVQYPCHTPVTHNAILLSRTSVKVTLAEVNFTKQSIARALRQK